MSVSSSSAKFVWQDRTLSMAKEMAVEFAKAGFMPEPREVDKAVVHIAGDDVTEEWATEMRKAFWEAHEEAW